MSITSSQGSDSRILAEMFGQRVKVKVNVTVMMKVNEAYIGRQLLGSNVFEVKGRVGQWKERGVTAWISQSDLGKKGYVGQLEGIRVQYKFTLL